jgi:uncharacterized membrane protein YkoI
MVIEINLFNEEEVFKCMKIITMEIQHQCIDKELQENKPKKSPLNVYLEKILHVDMDLENGVLVYEVFILTPENRIFEVEILAKSGRIIKTDEENDFD